MATYISLISWTDKGVSTYQDTFDRASAAGELASKMGATLKEVYWTIGPYDIVAVSEAPDDETATAFALALSSQGNVRTTTLRGFNADEMRAVVSKIG